MFRSLTSAKNKRTKINTKRLKSSSKRFATLLALIAFSHAPQALNAQSPEATPSTTPANTTPANSAPIVATPEDPHLWNIVNQSLGELDPTRLPNLAASRENLDKQINRFEQFLDTSPTEGPAWKKFLRWDELKKTLASQNPNPDRIVEIEKRFRQNYPGLERSEYTALRDALAKYSQDLRVGSKPDETMQILKNRLTKISERMQLPDMQRDPIAMYDLAQLASYLKQSNQAPTLVSNLLGRYSHPNVQVLASDDFIRQAFSRPVAQSSPVHEVILGTDIHGQGMLCGSVTPQLVNNPNQATLRLLMQGDFSSQNKGYNRSVVLNTRGQADVVACESLTLGDSGLSTLGDTGVDATLRTTIDSIEHRSKLVRKIASKQAAKKKPQADAIGEARMENRIRTQFHEQLGEQISEANAKLRNALETPVLKRLGITPPHRSSWSTSEELGLQWKVQSGSQLAADNACPFPSDPCGLTIRVHQSLLGNLLDPVLTGRVLRSEEMDGYTAQFGEAARGIPRNPDDGPWAIHLRGFRPVDVIFDDSLVKFRIRTLKLEREDQSLDQAATIEAAYRLVQGDDGTIQLERQGELNVEFVGKAQRGVLGVTLRTFLKDKFEQLFRPQLFDKPVRWADRLPEQFRDLNLCSVAIDDGWLQLQVRK